MVSLPALWAMTLALTDEEAAARQAPEAGARLRPLPVRASARPAQVNLGQAGTTDAPARAAATASRR
jgi:hypothetical protein